MKTIEFIFSTSHIGGNVLMFEDNYYKSEDSLRKILNKNIDISIRSTAE